MQQPFFSFLAAALLATFPILTTGDPCLRSGPMLGAAEIQDAAIWLQTHHPCRMQLRYWPEGKTESARLSPEILTSTEGDHIARFDLSSLDFGTRYRYELYANGQLVPLKGDPAFSTQPMWRWRTDPPDLRVALGSCAYINDPPFDRPGTPYGGGLHIFDTVAEQAPDLMIWLGDNVYYREADWLTEAGLRSRFAHSRSASGLQRLLAATAHYATWDDHDYGPNNSDRSYRLRREALDVFEDYFPNPPLGNGEIPGVFFRFEWADVEFFVLDNRYHRAPNQLPPGPEKVMFGPEQMRWLRDALVSSLSTFKVVVSGNQMLNPWLHSPSWQEMWTLYPEERQSFLDFLAAAKVEGVLFLSGDRHHTELLKIERPDLYPLYEFTSSPLTAGTASGDREQDNPARVQGTLVTKTRNFGLLDVEGPADDRRMILRTLDGQGQELWRHVIHHSELTLPAEAP